MRTRSFTPAGRVERNNGRNLSARSLLARAEMRLSALVAVDQPSLSLSLLFHKSTSNVLCNDVGEDQTCIDSQRGQYSGRLLQQRPRNCGSEKSFPV